MRYRKIGGLLLAGCLWLGAATQGAEAPDLVPVVVGPHVAPSIRVAAQELAGFLQQLYPPTRFVVTEPTPGSSPLIRVGLATDAEIGGGTLTLVAPDSFKVYTRTENGRAVGVVAGADTRGTLYGVHALLEKLGCGFYISGDALPVPRWGAFSFEGWELADSPLVRDRLVFDWHNFLSGCSTWNLPDWQAWIRQAQKQRFSAVMVHAYGNNPMVSFTFNNKTKPVGYLSTTARGRDWSTMHVNDVRRIWGGTVFQQPVFGADAAQGPEDQRAAAARKLMQGVFAYAAERAMDVFFADDVDTGSANPQELILTLPESARFAVQTKAGGLSGIHGDGDHAFWLANPETPEGYAYYKAQVAALLADYPQITTLVVWFRGGGTPWMDAKLAELPPSWQAEFNAAVAKNPAAAKYWHAHNLFAIGKITRAFDRALKELGQERVQLAAGTWNFAFLSGADLFLPPQVKLIGLDYGVLHDDSKLGTAEKRQKLAEVGAHRAIIPVIWAHHDDGNYIGRPYTPFPEFYSKLTEAKASGYGIIHWTTRPLDLFFKSHAEQVWSATKDRSLRATCDDMAAREFGVPLGEYLERWVTDAPKFARETSDHFIDRPLTNVAQVETGCYERLKLIAMVDQSKLTATQRVRLNYYKGLEEFISAFFRNHDAFQQAQALLKAGDLVGARAALAKCEPEAVIEQFAQFSSLGGMARGEQGLVVSLNTRWLPHIVRLRQQLGMDAIRYAFGPTSHDPLAQAPGRFTFYIGAGRRLWQTLGKEETGADVFGPSTISELGHSGIESTNQIVVPLRPIVGARKDGAVVPAGDYRVRLIMLDPVSTAAAQRVFRIAVTANGNGTDSAYAFEPEHARYLRLVCHGNAQNDWNSIEEVTLDALAKDTNAPLVIASRELKDFPATAAADGQLGTRWATRGRDEWIQFRLDPNVPVARLGIAWFGGAERQPKFEVLVSDDGQHWRTVKNFHTAETLASGPETRMDIFAQAGGQNRILEWIWPVKLPRPGCVTVTLTPVVGKALLCGAVLEPVAKP
ncbi:MAG: discoidin domain-containing protein [Kiritimatiellaeota bacterium]|nr:discoidin domain-containing protein [Kiritimatiellota bacterium]